MLLVGLLVTLDAKDRSPAPPGKGADPKESLQDFEGRGRSMAVIGDRRFRVERCVKAHWLPRRSTRPRSLHGTERSRTAPNRVGITEPAGRLIRTAALVPPWRRREAPRHTVVPCSLGSRSPPAHAARSGSSSSPTSSTARR